MNKVYVHADAHGRVIAINSDAFLPDATDWVQIDEGEGDRYHHAQGNYLPDGLTTTEGIYRYKLEGGALAERAPEEIAADIDALPPPPPSTSDITRGTMLAFQALAAAGTITEDQAVENKTLFKRWEEHIGQRAEPHTYWQHNGLLYRVNEGQGHTIQADWPPDTAASLFSRIGNPEEEYPEWIQPTGAHNAYSEGDKVSHNGKRWVNTHPGQNTNSWEPGVYGWTEVTA